ncbi:MAG: magnesium protoporphyrin IX methyltransferase [Burkholderiaceae bacterium]|nr:magnesium protoporphyrin IX methyltransferase [Burkholderiaceae bacterium]
MNTVSYTRRRSQLEDYFDRTAAETWSRLTSDAPVSRIRATVRAGRGTMRDTLLGWLPPELHGIRVLDAGCGTGALATEAALRGGDVLAVDIAASLLDTARERLPALPGGGRVEFIAGDMLSPVHGRFDYAVAMDSLIHYQLRDTLDALATLAERVNRGILFTFAPRTPLLAVMHAVGRCFPRGDRAPAIEPVAFEKLVRGIERHPGLRDWRIGRTRRVACGFYTSQALELTRA